MSSSSSGVILGWMASGVIVVVAVVTAPVWMPLAMIGMKAHGWRWADVWRECNRESGFED